MAHALNTACKEGKRLAQRRADTTTLHTNESKAHLCAWACPSMRNELGRWLAAGVFSMKSNLNLRVFAISVLLVLAAPLSLIRFPANAFGITFETNRDAQTSIQGLILGDPLRRHSTSHRKAQEESSQSRCIQQVMVPSRGSF